MRQVGRLANEIDARRFAAFLQQQQMDPVVQNDGETWLIWVRNEDQLTAAREAFEHFLGNPRDSRYQQAESIVELPRKPPPRPRRLLRRWEWWRVFGDPYDRPDTVVALIVITLLVTLGSWLPAGSVSDTLHRVLSFADSQQPAGANAAFHSVAEGEAWRLITPVFLHFSWAHLLFNMVLFYYLGAQVERLRGPVALGWLLLLLAVISNSAQAYFVGPNFGGMSGVVYGLLGYIWIKSSYEPGSGFFVHPLILAFALAEFLLSLFVWQESIANYAHAGGLIAGIVIGLAPSRRDVPPSEGVM